MGLAAVPAAASDLPRAEPEQAGLDRDELRDMARYAMQNGTTALIVMRGGAVVLERGSNAMQDGYSIAKGLAAIAVGVAIADGEMSLNDDVRDYFPALPAVWGSITLRFLLEMRSGIDINNTDQYQAMIATDDWGAYAMSRPVNKTPGTWWRYKADPQVVSNMFTAATGESMWSYLQSRVLTPIGITSQVSWEADATGHTNGSGGFSTTAENYARIGQLLLDDGEWDGQQLVPSSWINQMTAPCHDNGWSFQNLWAAAGQAWATPGEYGFYWWCRQWDEAAPTTPQDAFYAFGGTGQFIIVIPSLDMVVVRLGSGPQYADGVFLQEMLRFIQRAAS